MRMTTGDLGMVMPSRSIQSSYMSSSPSHSTGKKEEVVKDQFPAGLRVLVVDDDHMTLLILEKMLRSCSYTVTTCGKARAALALLRENKNDFDLVLSDVYMPDMDGFKLLELVGLEMDLPVIMMSSDGDKSNVMKGITHGACDYLLKPVRMEELRNIWQHVVRKKAKEVDHVSSQEACNEKQKRGGEDGEPTSSTNSKKRKDVKEEEEDLDHDNDDPSSLKKPRVVWSVELHQKFVNAVNQLGIDKAVPKKILELMEIAGLTRENVASHLQKYRLYLKRISVQQQQNGMNLSFGGPTEGGSEVRPLPGNSSFPMQHLGTVQQGVLGRLGNTNSLTTNSLDPSLLQFVGIQGGPLFSPRLPSPVFSSQTNYLPTFTGGYQLEHTQQLSPFGAVAPSVDDVAGLNTLQHQVPNTGKHSSMSNLGGLTGTFCTSQGSNSLMVQLLQQRQQQPYAQHQGVNMAMGGGLGQHRNEVVNLGINTGLVDDIGYAPLGGINTPTGGGGNPALIENKSVGMLGVVDSNFPPASLNASGVPLATPVPPFDADVGGKISPLDSTTMQGLGQSLNAVANLSTGFGMTYNQNRIPGWQSQELGQIYSPVVTPRYSQSVASQNFTVQNQVNAHEHKKMELGRPGLRDSNSEQSTADSSFKPKAISGSLISAKLGLQIDQAPASDDLLSFYLKQEQQELSFPENDLAFDGYIPDNLYVK